VRARDGAGSATHDRRARRAHTSAIRRKVTREARHTPSHPSNPSRGGSTMATAPASAPMTAKSVPVRQTKMLIDGKWVASTSGRTFETLNPATGEVIANVAEGDKADVDKAVKAARKAFEKGPWKKMTARERARILYKLADLVEQNKEELAKLEALDNGKPLSV